MTLDFDRECVFNVNSFYFFLKNIFIKNVLFFNMCWNKDYYYIMILKLGLVDLVIYCFYLKFICFINVDFWGIFWV